jgi:hypothetical protein
MKNFFILRQLVICRLSQEPRLARVGFRLGTAMILSLAVICVTPHLISQAQAQQHPDDSTHAQQSRRDSPSSALPAQSHSQRDAATDPQAGEEVTVQAEDEVALAALASIYSGTSVFIVIALGLFGLRVSSKLRSHQAVAQADSEPHFETRESETANTEDPGFAFQPAAESNQQPNSEPELQEDFDHLEI